jgi:hypothetical protein
MCPAIWHSLAATRSYQRQIRTQLWVGEAVGDGLAGVDVPALGVADGAVVRAGADDVAGRVAADGVADAVREGCVALG